FGDILLRMKRFVILLLLLPTSICFAGVSFTLGATQWAVPKSGETVRTMPVLVSVMRELRVNPGSHLLVRYPGGDEGTLWAHELRGWLVSLGLASRRIELQQGSASGAAIELTVLPPRERDVRATQ
ncbi:MAG: hypothetical protein JSW10_09740, partial [Pseudomonadota bacterium]